MSRHIRATISVAYDDSESVSDPEGVLDGEISSWVSRGGLAPAESDLVVEDYTVVIEEVTAS